MFGWRKRDIDRLNKINISKVELELTHSRDEVQNLEKLLHQQVKEFIEQKTKVELELTHSRDRIRSLEALSVEHSKDLSEHKRKLDSIGQILCDISNEVKKDVTSSKTETTIGEELEEIDKENREITIQVLKLETIELKKRLLNYVEERQQPLDHFEFALTNYKNRDFTKKAPKIWGYNRYDVEKHLPRSVKNNKNCLVWARIQKEFGYGCAITGVNHYDFEHFIPIHTGHGGAYEGNIIPMKWQLNSSKRNKNPFHWFREMQIKDPSLSLKRWNNLIEYLAAKNDLSVEEYFEFVNWCFTNPRTAAQLELINSPSIELWRDSKTIIK
ncbi:hypothetical protein ACNA6I_17450 [Rossellomorea sp. FS2]|uniref:hypothetical protein n=1 Tax=Rossellomorea sp. FS2 TaxID=3391447 RepID=UPI003A4D8DF5